MAGAPPRGGEQLAQGDVDPPQAPARAHDGHARGRAVERRAQRDLGALVLRDVGRDAAHAEERARGVAQGELHGLVGAQPTVPARELLAAEGLPAGDDGLVVGGVRRGEVGREELVVALAQRLAGLEAEQLLEAAVHEDVATLEVLRGDDRGGVVHEGAQPLLDGVALGDLEAQGDLRARRGGEVVQEGDVVRAPRPRGLVSATQNEPRTGPPGSARGTPA